MAHGYLGFGLDVFGNYHGSQFGGIPCSADTDNVKKPQNVTVRGPGDRADGYCILGSTAVTNGALDAPGSTTRPAPVPVEIALNPERPVPPARRRPA